jgi:SagB-type dehydrogenase family enzyme
MILIAADYRRTEAKYGKKARRFVHIEVGHAGHNILLQATAMGLHGVGVGAFHPVRVKETLGLPAPQELLYVLVLGNPP